MAIMISDGCADDNCGFLQSSLLDDRERALKADGLTKLDEQAVLEECEAERGVLEECEAGASFVCELFDCIEAASTVVSTPSVFGSDPSFSVAVEDAPPKEKKGGRKDPGREA
mmetsp:Transcript_18897/g.34835  ORF Transcript_18897/g.34835 Transcript_18897/m.34835 type:complete len:113 (+) Transcript_18897:1569-1907(+)